MFQKKTKNNILFSFWLSPSIKMSSIITMNEKWTFLVNNWVLSKFFSGWCLFVALQNLGKQTNRIKKTVTMLPKKKSKKFLNFLLEPSRSKMDHKKIINKNWSFFGGTKASEKYHEMEHNFKGEKFFKIFWIFFFPKKWPEKKNVFECQKSFR